MSDAMFGLLMLAGVAVVWLAAPVGRWVSRIPERTRARRHD